MVDAIGALARDIISPAIYDESYFTILRRHAAECALHIPLKALGAAMPAMASAMPLPPTRGKRRGRRYRRDTVATLFDILRVLFLSIYGPAGAHGAPHVDVDAYQ